MRILALEPFYGGSHRAFLDGWHLTSRHDWTLVTLPATKWKWRMRHAAISIAQEVQNHIDEGRSWDLILATDMLNLAEFRGLVDQQVAQLPAVAYFHENQLTYPVREERERDYHFAMSNVVTCLATDQVWFNSAFHRDSFLTAVDDWLSRMPDHRLPGAAETIAQRSIIMPQGIERIPERPSRQPGPMRILWSARWEHDKDPDCIFGALRQLKRSGVEFRVSMIGQQFADQPTIFDLAREEFADLIDHWGFQESREKYLACLLEADLIVSTAQHEFFGVAVVEAIAAGARPLLPERLAYPEILGKNDGLDPTPFLYDGTVDHLARRLAELSEKESSASLVDDDLLRLRGHIARFEYDHLVPHFDDALETIRPNRNF